MIDNWDEIIANRAWAEPYFRSLSKLNKDLEIKRELNSRIYVAIDFFDIYEHCFPKIKWFIDEKYIQERDEFLRRENGRYALFYILKNLYKHPIVILPPHFSELTSFYNWYEKQIRTLKTAAEL